MTDNLAPLWRRMAQRVVSIGMSRKSAKETDAALENFFKSELAGVLGAAQELLDTMETCHICKGK